MSGQTSPGEASLELAGLRRRFGTVTALDGLTFSVPPGQVFGSRVRLRRVLGNQPAA